MPGVFSRLRAALFDNSRVRSYMLYATGEVVLIVVGILIAIQLDAAQEQRFERGLERNYITNLLDDVRFDVRRYDDWMTRFDGKIAGLLAAKAYYFGEAGPEDTDAFLNTVGFGGVGSRGRNLAVTATFQELISTGNLRLIRNSALKAEILDYHLYKDFLDDYTANLRSEYATYVNSSRPYSPSGDLPPDPRDVPVALARFRAPEFLALINQELTFAYSVNVVMEGHIENAKVLAQHLEDYLETF